jgi:hypothetical protein
MTLALGGDCLADIAVLRSQPELAGARAPGAGGPLIPVGIVATLVIAHSEKKAAPTWKKTSWFHSPRRVRRPWRRGGRGSAGHHAAAREC